MGKHKQWMKTMGDLDKGQNSITEKLIHHKILKLEESMLKDKKILAYLDNEALKMRLELANLLVENPQIVEAMEVSGTTLPTEAQAPIDTEGNFQVEAPSAIPENTDAQGEPETGSFSGNENQPAQA